MRVERSFEVFGSTRTAVQWGNPNGAPTFALHGWLDNANTFNRLAPLLPELNLLALDFAGHGHSDHRPPGVHYHALLDVQDVLTIADQLGWQRFNLIGHSMGAGITAELSGLFPERVRRAVMIDGFLSTGGAATDARIGDDREAVQQMLSAANKRPRVYASIDEMVRRVVEATDQSTQAAEALVARGNKAVPGGFTWRTDPRIRFRTPLRMNGEQIDTLLSRVTAPSLLIVASRGDRWYLNDLETRRRAHLILALAHVDGPHHLHLEPGHYRDVAVVVREFLDLASAAAAAE